MQGRSERNELVIQLRIRAYNAVSKRELSRMELVQQCVQWSTGRSSDL